MSRKGKIRPIETPSVWPSVPQSTPDAPPRKTLKSSFEVRGAKPDEMNVFQEQDRMNYSDTVKRVISNRHEFRSPTVAYNYDTSLYIQSVVLSEGVPKFILEIEQSLNFKTFHMGRKVSVPFIVKNKIRILNSWPAIEEIITQLSTFDTAHKTDVIHQQLKIMSSNSVGTKLYPPDVIV